MNPLGVHALVWTGGQSRADLEHAVRCTHEAGYDLLELPAFDAGWIDTAHLRALLEEHRIAGACSLGLDPDCDLSSPDAEVSAAGERRLGGALDVVAAIGGSYLGGVVYSALGKYDVAPDPRGRAHMVAGLRRLAARAAEVGVTVGLEPVNRYESNVINTVGQALDVIDEVASGNGADNVVVHLDVYHANIEESSPAAAVRQAAAGARLGYVHIGESHRGYLGTGSVDFPAFFGALREVGYAGPITFESFSRAVVSPHLSNRLAVWRDLWTDGMDLARHARTFILDHIGAAGVPAPGPRPAPPER